MSKNKKKGKRADVAFEDGPAPGEGSDTEAAAATGDISVAKKPVEMTAEDLADEEWGPVKEKGKKAKKGKGKKGKTQADEDEDEAEGELRTNRSDDEVDLNLRACSPGTGCSTRPHRDTDYRAAYRG